MNYKEYGTMSAVQKTILDEVQKNSGLAIHTNNFMKFKAECGPIAHQADGCYARTQPWYSPIEEEMLFWNIPFADERAMSVLFHELGHATGHKTRLDRMLDNNDQKALCMEESIAEYTAVALMKYFGFETAHTYNWSMKYINMCNKVLTDAAQAYAKAESSKAIVYILDNWLADFNKSQKKAV